MDTITRYLWKLVPEYFTTLPCHMDFEGQRRAEIIFQVIVTVFGAVGFVWGYIVQQFSQTFYIVLAGFILSSLLTLPPWPFYRRHPLSWQKVKKTEENGDAENKKPKENKKKKKIN